MWGNTEVGETGRGPGVGWVQGWNDLNGGAPPDAGALGRGGSGDTASGHHELGWTVSSTCKLCGTSNQDDLLRLQRAAGIPFTHMGLLFG